MTSNFPSPEEFEEFLRKFGAEAGRGDEFAQLSEAMGPLKSIFESIEGAISGSSTSAERPIDWATALKTANKTVSDRALVNFATASQSALHDAGQIASAWVSSNTVFSSQVSSCEPIPRSQWPALSLASLKLIAAPIAQRSSEDAVANFRNLMPGQPDEFYRTVSEKMSGVAAHLYGVQLGQLLGVLAEGVLIGSEFSLVAGQSPALIAENCQEFASSISADPTDVYIYLASRELLTAALLDANPWLRESLVTQVARYAGAIAFNSEGLQELQNAIQESDFESLNDLMGTLVNVRPSPEQTESLASLQHLLTLLTGWVDHVTLLACRHLTGLAAIDEAYRRRRVTSSPMSKVFKLLLNTEVDPARVRTAASFWATVSEKLDATERDRLWNHPDLLPTPAEVANPQLLLERIDGQPEDAMDAALRKLLGESER